MLPVFSRFAFQVVRWTNRILTRDYEVRLAETEEDFQQVWRLNYETYVQELGHEQVPADIAASGMLPDRLRDTTRYIVAFHRGKLVGMMALTLPAGPFSIESSLSVPSVLDGRRDRTVEFRRLAVRKEHRGKGVFLRMTDTLRPPAPPVALPGRAPAGRAAHEGPRDHVPRRVLLGRGRRGHRH